MDINDIGRMIALFGLMLVLLGGLLIFTARIPGIGRLPGDIYIKRDGFSLYFPLATSILLSIILTIILNLFLRR